MPSVSDLPLTGYPTAETLAEHYKLFAVGDRVLLTGHSHQAWPDVALEGQQAAFRDAAELVDDKWDRAFAAADAVRDGFARLLDDADGYIALGPNTHELVARFLSALPLRQKPRLVTTDGEFHTIRRQLDRIEEEGIEIVRVPAAEGRLVSEALIAEIDDRTAAVLVSSVLFRNGHLVPGLPAVARACEEAGVELLVDTYHSLGAVPFSIGDEGLDGAFVVGGGYKYLQLGEGNCFLRFPSASEHRPVYTGWFAEFGELSRAERSSRVPYGGGPARFAGATYDPTSHYRARSVFQFFADQGLDAPTLRAISQAQVARLISRIDALDLPPSVLDRDRDTPLDAIGGFVALQTDRAGEISAGLRTRGVYSDYRGSVLRLGPAPYVTDRQLDDGVVALAEVINGL